MTKTFTAVDKLRGAYLFVSMYVSNYVCICVYICLYLSLSLSLSLLLLMLSVLLIDYGPQYECFIMLLFV